MKEDTAAKAADKPAKAEAPETPLKLFDDACDALANAPLLHKGECAECALNALKLVLVDLYQRLPTDADT